MSICSNTSRMSAVTAKTATAAVLTRDATPSAWEQTRHVLQAHKSKCLRDNRDQIAYSFKRSILARCPGQRALARAPRVAAAGRLYPFEVASGSR